MGKKVASSYNKFEPWLVVFSASLFFFFELIQVNIFNSLNPQLMQTFHVGGSRLGAISATYFLANIIFLFPAGIIIDKFSVKKVIIVSMTALVASTFFFGLSTSIWQLQLARFAMGIGGCFTLTSCIRLAVRWFPLQKIALITGLIITFSMLGGVLAQTPVALLTDAIGWRKTIFLDSLFGLVLVLVISLFVKDYPPLKEFFNQDYAESSSESSLSLFQMIIQSVKNSQNWLAGLYTSLMNIPLILLGAMWGSLYLTQARHLSHSDSTLVTSMIFIGTILGAPVLGWLSEKAHRRKRLMIMSSLIAFFIMLVIIYAVDLTMSELLTLFFILGFFTSAQVLSYPLIAESNPPNLTASSEGLAQTLIMAGGFTQPFFGYLIEKNWNHRVINHIAIYSVKNYQFALMSILIGFLIALLSAIIAKEPVCQPRNDFH